MDIIRRPACLVVNPITVYSYAWVPLSLNDGWSGLRLNEALGIKRSPGVCLWLGPPWLNLSFSLALTDCES